MPGKVLNKRCDFMHSGMILSSNFVSFWRHCFGILSFDLARKHCNGKKKTLCWHRCAPIHFFLDRVFFGVFFLLLSLGVFVCLF